jgi:hypothetical protein
MVGARGFEPPTTCTPCMYATRLRYAPTKDKIVSVTIWRESAGQLAILRAGAGLRELLLGDCVRR